MRRVSFGVSVCFKFFGEQIYFFIFNFISNFFRREVKLFVYHDIFSPHHPPTLPIPVLNPPTNKLVLSAREVVQLLGSLSSKSV